MQAKMIECGICLEEYQEGDLEVHQCVIRLRFRCSLCAEDYVSKEGLWNHLDLHEIVDESKELHYQEIQEKCKFRQCVLCNDQRAYLESSYWKHVHEVHDGFFLRCSDCGENFRSEKRRDDHVLNHCKGRDATVALDVNAPEQEQVPIEADRMTSEAEHLEILQGEHSINANEGLDNRLSEDSRVCLNSANDDDSSIELPTINSTKSKVRPLQFACDICGTTFSSIGFYRRHKESKTTCLNGKKMQKCPNCRKAFRAEEYQAHSLICEENTFTCKFCPLKYKTLASATRHMKYMHLRKGGLKNQEEDQKQVKNMNGHMINSDAKTATRPESSDTNVADDKDSSIDQKDTADESVQVHAEKPPTKCIHCAKECASVYYLRQHILVAHQPSKCNICGIICTGHSRLRYHKKHTHNETHKQKYECAKCSKEFGSIKRYWHHANVCDPVKNNISIYKSYSELIPQNEREQLVVAENPSSESQSTKCPLCGVEESSAVSLGCHILTHHDPVACDFCGITLPSLAQAQQHQKTMHREPKRKCPHCLIQLHSIKGLNSHVSKCVNYIIPCDLCGKMFKTERCVKYHKRYFCPAAERSKDQGQNSAETSRCDETGSSTAMEKPSLPPVQRGLSQTLCYYCNEELFRPGYLRRHLKMTHALTKCDVCDITVIGLSAYKNHRIICHTEPKYECQTCKEKFYYKRKLQQHGYICGFRTYPCSVCGRMFKDLEAIKNHNRRIHRDEERGAETQKKVVRSRSNQAFMCNICGLILYGRDKRYRHMLTKHTEAKFKCPHCPKRFHQKQKYDAHHTGCGRKRWSCKLCGRRFQRYASVEQHINRAHPGESIADNIQRIQDGNHAQNDDLKTEITVEESTISVRDDLGQSTINPSSKVDVSNSNEHSIVQLNDGEFTDAQDIDTKSPMVSVAPLSNSSTISSAIRAHDESQYSAAEIPLLHVKEAETNSTIVPKVENMKFDDTELELNIKVEETMLQEQEYQVPNEDPGRSCGTTLPTTANHADSVYCRGYVPVKTCSFENAESFVKNFELGFSFLRKHKGEKGTVRYYRCLRLRHSVRPQCDRKMSIFTPNIDGESTVSVRGKHSCIDAPPEKLSPRVALRQTDIIRKLLDSGVPNKDVKNHVKLLEERALENVLKQPDNPPPNPQCALCHKKFHTNRNLRLHAMRCLGVRCNKCNILFTTRSQLNNHNKRKHPNDGKSKGVEAEDHQTGITVDEEYAEAEEEIVSTKKPDQTSLKPQCTLCKRKFYNKRNLRRHALRCSGVRCNKCNVLFATHIQLNKHNNHKHPLDGKSKDIDFSFNLETGDNVNEEYAEAEKETATTEDPSTTKSAQYNEVDSDRNETPVPPERMDVH